MPDRQLQFLITANETATPVMKRVEQGFMELQQLQQQQLESEVAAVQMATEREVAARKIALEEEEADQMSFMEKMRGDFGRGSPLGMLASGLRGAGPLLAIGIFSRMIGGIGEGLAKVREDTDYIHKGWGDILSDFSKSIPLLGDIGSLADGITDAFSDRKQIRAHEESRSKMLSEATDDLIKQQDLQHDAQVAVMKDHAEKIGMGKDFDIRTESSDKIFAARKVRDNSLSDLQSKFNALSPAEREGDFGTQMRQRMDDIGASFEKTSEAFRQHMDDELGKLGKERFKAIADAISGALGKVLAPIEKSAPGAVAGQLGGFIGMFQNLAARPTKRGEVGVSGELPDLSELQTGDTGFAAAAKERLMIQASSERNEQAAQDRKDAQEAKDAERKRIEETAKLNTTIGNLIEVLKHPGNSNFFTALFSPH